VALTECSGCGQVCVWLIQSAMFVSVSTVLIGADLMQKLHSYPVPGTAVVICSSVIKFRELTISLCVSGFVTFITVDHSGHAA
jgi:hypothetical protein